MPPLQRIEIKKSVALIACNVIEHGKLINGSAAVCVHTRRMRNARLRTHCVYATFAAAFCRFFFLFFSFLHLCTARYTIFFCSE